MSEQSGAVLNQVRWLTIGTDEAGQRIDNFLRTRLKGVPRTRIYRLLRKGEVRVNKQRVKPDYRLDAEDRVRIPPVRVAQSQAVAPLGRGLAAVLEQSILFEDAGLLVVNKPSGLAVHGGSGVSLGLIEALRQLRPQARFLELVHRLDRDTSGCVMVAKKRSVLKQLHAALREGAIDKRYQALVAGRWPRRRQRVEAPLRRNELKSGERVVRVHPEGKQALTEFRVLQRFAECTLVDVRPITGRTHQIRVHAQFAGHPVVGDEKYGDEVLNRQLKGAGVRRLFLHAAELRLTVPGEARERTICAPLEPALEVALRTLAEAKAR